MLKILKMFNGPKSKPGAAFSYGTGFQDVFEVIPLGL